MENDYPCGVFEQNLQFPCPLLCVRRFYDFVLFNLKPSIK